MRIENSKLRPRQRPRQLLWLAGLALCSVAAGGCLGPMAVSQTRTKYNEVYRKTNDEQLLLNIVRLRYADSPIFIDLPNITSQFEVANRGSYSYGLDGSGPGLSNLGFGELLLRDTPTLSYHPRSGQEIAKALLTPLSAELLSAVNAGATLDQFLLLAVNDINDVPNASRSIALIPNAADDNGEFRRGIELLDILSQNGTIELTVRKLEESDGSDPIPARQIRGSDLISAAKDDYVIRSTGNDQVYVRKHERLLVLRVRPDEVDSPGMLELARIFRLKPGLSQYKIKSELTGEHRGDQAASDDLEPGDTLFMNMRSMLQISAFLSKGVCIPDEHARSGIAPVTRLDGGELFDWSRLTDGLFRVHVQKRRPRNAEVAVRYRGHWFYIACDDVNSRATLAIYEILFTVQESEGKSAGPLLTLPIGS